MNRGDIGLLVSIFSPIFTILGVAYHNAKNSGASAAKQDSFEKDINALQAADTAFAQRLNDFADRLSRMEGREDGRNHREK